MGFGLALTTTNRWPGGIIPFEIDATAFPAGSIQRQRVIQAINAWNNASIIRLVPRSAPPNAETDFARFVSGAACNTASGRQSGTITVSPYWSIRGVTPRCRIRRR